jgi:hypothetical protein
MTDKRKRSARGLMKTAAVFMALGSLGAAYGCSSDNSSAPPDNGNGGAGGGGACGTKINDAKAYPACTTCTGGRCVPKSLVATSGLASFLTACDADNVCVSDNVVEQGENLKLAKCTSIAGGEGRCVSTCIGVVASLAPYLPTTGCATNERCAPCFNPASGQETGLCGLGCDDKAMAPAVKFPTCCVSDGLCAPKSALPQELASALGKESCANADDVCVPAKPIATPGAKFSCCTIPPPAPNPSAPPTAGACVSACVIGAGPIGDQIPQGSCGTSEKCVPCANPVNGTKTGVCTDATGQPAATCTP